MTSRIKPCNRQLVRQEPQCLVSYSFGSGRHKEATEMLVQQLMILNPDANRDRILKGRSFDANGLLKDWDLHNGNIAELPECFGDVLCTGDLLLSFNQLESLLLSISNLTLGGDLSLGYNKLRRLPPNFEQIRVGEMLGLYNNPELTRIPTQFPNVKGDVCR